MNTILIGMKACGKSTVGRLLAKKLKIKFLELDQEIEKVHLLNKKDNITFREIFKKHGVDYFRQLESIALEKIFKEKKTKEFVLSCGGGTPLDEKNRIIIKKLGRVIFLDADEDVLFQRITKHGIPAFFPYPNDQKKSLSELLEKRRPIYNMIADKIISFENESPEELVEKII